MKLLPLYLEKMTTLVNSFNDNENLHKQAIDFWKNLESISFLFPIIAFAIATAMAWVYFFPYNNKPNRHYRPINWYMFLAWAYVFTSVVTIACELSIVAPKLDGALWLEIRLALKNGLLSIVLYIFCSYVFARNPKTNAFKQFYKLW